MLAPGIYCTTCGFTLSDETEKSKFIRCRQEVDSATGASLQLDHTWKDVSTAIGELIEIEKSLR